MPKLLINGQEITVPEGYTVLQAAQLVDVEIPVFCFHERLQIAGNCRMCLVELNNSPKPIASCAMPATEGMIINTKTDMVKKARKGVLEFLLINHPLDCPICDQGGECDLQDITMAYGPSTSRYHENKRAVSPKNMGPLVKTFMTRCIHCTRCVRFAEEVAGVPELGAVHRGEHMEITTYLDQALTSEMSGNVIDLCPVGALTSGPYSFKGRPWELTPIETVDVLDAVGSNIRADIFGLKVMRILPRLNEDINEEWISDKTRFAVDGLMRQRIDQPYVRRQGKLEKATWGEALSLIKKELNKCKGNEIAALAGDLTDVESMIALKDLMMALESPHLDCRQAGEALNTNYRSWYLFNTSFKGIEEADFCLIVGANIRVDAPLVHTRLRKRARMGGFDVAYLGGKLPTHRDFTFSVERLGDDPKLIEAIISGKHPLSKKIANAKKPMIILGMDALTRPDGESILASLAAFAAETPLIQNDWNGFNILHKAAGRVGGLDVGFIPQKQGKSTADILKAASAGDLKVVYLLGADEVDLDAFKKTFVIYQGHHGDRGAHAADVVLPGATYLEKNATYVNMEGRVQQTIQGLQPPGEAKEDWRIIAALAESLGHALPYHTLAEIRQRMARENVIFERFDEISTMPWRPMPKLKSMIMSEPFKPASWSFYMTDPISRHSPTMARCIQEIDEPIRQVEGAYV
ncbi:MAG: NADH-quinone oxidoreductase subunit NuoG [Candidatus Nucleicultricaceae bacterium]